MEVAPTPEIIDNFEKIKDIQFLKESFGIKLDSVNYIINIGTLKDALVIKVNSNEIQNVYQSLFTIEELKSIAKSMRYFDDINDIISFIANKGKKNEIFLKKEKIDLFINFKVTSPNGKEEDILLKVKPKELNEKETISFLLKKINSLEKEIKTLKERINASDNIILEHKNNFSKLFSEIELLKNQSNKIERKEKSNIIDSKITNEKELDFIIQFLKKSPLLNNKNFKFDLLYRGTRDGDDTVNLHKKCCGYKNVIIFMKSEEGKKYWGFTNIGWETRNKGKWEYPIDDKSFLFSIDNKKIFKAIKGKNKMCWVNSDEYGLCFYNALVFYNHFMTIEYANLGSDLEHNFMACHISDFNSGKECFIFSELEVFKINEFI